MLGSDRFASEEESDARTIVGSLLLRGMLPADGGPNVIIELLDPENVPLVNISRGEVIISPLAAGEVALGIRHGAEVSLNPSVEARLPADGTGDVVTLLSYR